MATVGTILVIAAEEGFRRSLRFVLEAEGYAVDTIESAVGIRSSGFMADCIVIDDKALVATNGDGIGHPKCPVVVLVDRASDIPAKGFYRMIEKPMLGEALVETVKSAILGRKRYGERPTT